MNPSDEIKQKMDIVEFVREYIPVKAVGGNFQALCPFHGEKTPSLVISPDKQIWHCFGCGKGGDIFSFLMDMEGLSFTEAIRQLAPRAGVTLKSQDPESFSKRNRALDAVALAVKYYNHLLGTTIGQKAKDYLLRRGLTEEVIKDWQIGYSPDSWDALFSFLATRPLEGQKYTTMEMAEAGLVIKKDGPGNRFFDRFRDRIMFPINDVNGNPIAFTARLNPEKDASQEKTGKYINSPQCAIYDKSRVLFGLDKAKGVIKEKNFAIVVEGQMDVITCHQFGFKNAVASSGTALTAEQISLLKRYTKNLALCFDADAAGQLAADRGIREAMLQGMNIKVIIIPHGKDPDDALRQDLASFVLAVRNAKPVMDYYFEKITAGLNLDMVEHKKEVSEKMLNMIVKLADKVEADYWLKTVSQTLGIDENILRESLPNNKETASLQRVEPSVKTTERSREAQLSELLLALVIKFPQFIDYVISKVEVDLLEGEDLGSFYKNLIIYYNKIKALDYESFRAYLQAESQEESVNLLDKLILLGEKDFYAYELESVQPEIIQITSELKKYYLQKKIAIASRAMALAEKNGEMDKINSILEELKRLNDLQRNNQSN